MTTMFLCINHGIATFIENTNYRLKIGFVIKIEMAAII